MTVDEEPSSGIAASVAESTVELYAVPDSLSLDIEIGETCLGAGDWPRVIESAVSAALRGGLSGPLPSSEIYVALVDNAQSQNLNANYRSKDKATNVLSFPGTDPDELSGALKFSAKGGPPVMLGDLIIADAVVASEARDQGKSNTAHLSHLVVHGVLHLLGYDHINDSDATEMETLEREILEGLGIKDPYEADEK